MAKRWYVVKVQSGRENTVQAALERKLKVAGKTEVISRVLVPVAAQHRAQRLPQANRFAPELWLDGSADADWLLNVFSRGGAQCAGRNLALQLGTASLAELLRQREYTLLDPKLAPDRALPFGINPLHVRFAVGGTPAMSPTS